MKPTIQFGDYMNTENTNKYRKYSFKTPLKKLILAQFGAAMLGIMTSMPTVTLASAGRTLDIATSLLAIGFLLYLQYTSLWDIGARDRISVDGGRLREDKLIGLKSALLANIPTYGLAVLCIIFKSVHLLTNAGWIGSAFNITYAIELMWNYMYHGLLVFFVPGSVGSWLNIPYLATFILFTAPSLITCLVAYRMGLSGKRIFPVRKKYN